MPEERWLMRADREEPCERHAALNKESGDSLVEPFKGEFARLSEWGRQRGIYPDGCPATWHARYNLDFRGQFVATDSGNVAFARMMREIAERLEASCQAEKASDA